MRDMPLSFEADAKGGFGFLHKFCRDFSQEIGGGGGVYGGFGGGDWSKLESFLTGVSGGGGVCEPTSVLETKRSPSSSSASTSTLSSSLAGGGSTDTAAVATFSGNPTEKWAQESSTDNSSNVDLEVFQQIPPNLEVDKCGGMDYWGDAHLLEPSGVSESESPGHDHSILRLIMGDVEDPSLGLNKLLQSPNPDLHFGGGGGGGLLGGVIDQGFGNNNNYPPSILPQNQVFNNPSFPIGLPQHPHSHMYEDEKTQVLNHPQLLINQVQAPNPGFFMPLQQHNSNSNAQDLPLAPPPKRQQMMIQKPGQLQLQMQMQFPPTSTSTTTQQLHLHSYPKMVGDEMMIQQQAIVDQLLKAAELIETGNPILAQEILARLNHHLSPIGKPFYRAAFYFKEALRLLLINNNNNCSIASTTASSASPFNLFFKIGAYKSFSEISPIVQFANFTCNQAVLEALEGFDMIRIVDFDIGYGGQWASLMQELALRKGGPPAIKITAFASLTTHDQLELSLTRENLIHFAQEINISFDLEMINIDCLSSPSSWPPPFRVAESEAIAVNLPVSLLSNSAMILRFIKQLAPKIVVSVDRGCDRTDLPFAHHIHQAFQSYLALLESLDAVNVNPDALQKIETFLVRPGIEKLILARYTSLDKTQHWKAQFLSAGLSPVSFSNFTECQAEWLLKRTLARGFHVEKRQSSLVLYFQRKELISASAWRC